MELYVRHRAQHGGVPIVASVPHSGLYVPPEINELFEPQHRRWLRNTDWYLPELYDFLPELGATSCARTRARRGLKLCRSNFAIRRTSTARRSMNRTGPFSSPIDWRGPAPAYAKRWSMRLLC